MSDFFLVIYLQASFLIHREAVASGLVSPCIMCLVLPQSEADYFCSRACKEDSMNKDKWDCSE